MSECARREKAEKYERFVKPGQFRLSRRLSEAFLTAVVYGAAGISLFLLSGMMGYVFFRGFRALSIRFFTTVSSALKGTVGIAGNLVNTLYIIVLTLLTAVPVGVGGAIYLSEYARPGRLVRLIEFAMEILTGIPSVVFGLFGMVFFGNVLGLGYSVLNGSFTLSLMVLPLIMKNTREALRATPESYRNGALGLGAAKWYMIRTILLPSAMPGILTGVVLAVGRILGESAALIFTAGSARLLPGLTGVPGEDLVKLGQKVLEPGGTLTLELYLQAENGRYEAAFGIACVLILMALLINLLLKLAAGRAGRA
ncbi:MAG: phosphate ABC transporter permease PstA [Butyrivibrio sp.]|nr:phosphate ABC transporter permease PstA [Acetatifactor muris]MCM1558439.1 phosphate ABC transporter permease PstA [Butyrivibrio sp.]